MVLVNDKEGNIFTCMTNAIGYEHMLSVYQCENCTIEEIHPPRTFGSDT